MTHLTCNLSLAISCPPVQILTLFTTLTYNLYKPSFKRNDSTSERRTGGSGSGTGSLFSSSYQRQTFICQSLTKPTSSEKKCIGSYVPLSSLHAWEVAIWPCLSPALKLKASSQSGLTHSFPIKKAAMLFVWRICLVITPLQRRKERGNYKAYTPIGSPPKILFLNSPNHSGVPTKNVLGSGPSEGSSARLWNRSPTLKANTGIMHLK